MTKIQWLFLSYIFLNFVVFERVESGKKGKRKRHPFPKEGPWEMGCDCGKRPENPEFENDCRESARLEDRREDQEKDDFRIVGGCKAGHVPWFVYFELPAGGGQRAKCG